MAEKFKLKWHDFHANFSKSLGLSRNEDYLHDVTLVSDDNVQMSAHKLVLSASSEYFKSIFKDNRKSHLVLCLEGLLSEELTNVLDYIYNGEIRVYQEYLERFLHLARRFQLDGLTFGNNAPPESRSKSLEEEPPELVPPPSPKALLVKDEHLDASFLPELVNGKILETKCQNKNI